MYANADAQRLVVVTLQAGARVDSAIFRSGLLEDCPEIDLTRNPVGIFGKRVALDTPLTDHDRVEIYRPLIISPTEARRLRAANRKPPR